jgi:hypothetical protein
MEASIICEGELTGRKSGFGKAGESEDQKKSQLCPAFWLNHSFAEKIFLLVVFTCTDLYWLVLARVFFGSV